jgi:hypothetical protein
MIDLLDLSDDKVVSGIDYKKIFNDALIDPSEEIKQQPIALSIGESNYKGISYPIPFGSYGDFSCIVGASKSRKTFFKSMIEASFIGGKSNIYNPSIKGHNADKKFVLSFDTEQSHFHAQRVQRRVLELIGGNCDFYKTFGLRGYTPKERFDFIDWVVFESEFKVFKKGYIICLGITLNRSSPFCRALIASLGRHKFDIFSK